MAESSPLRIVKTVPFRMSFPVLPPNEAREDEDSGRRTYQLAMLFPPGLVLEPFKVALFHAMADKFGPDSTKWPRVKQTPAHVLKDFEEYNRNSKTPLPGDWKGWTLIRANRGEKTKSGAPNPPGVVGPIRGADGKFPPITDARDIYGGRWARATIDGYHFEVKGQNNAVKNSGVTFGLVNVQLLKADKPFGAGKAAPEADFDDASEEWSGQGDAFEKGEAAGTDWG